MEVSGCSHITYPTPGMGAPVNLPQIIWISKWIRGCWEGWGTGNRSLQSVLQGRSVPSSNTSAEFLSWFFRVLHFKHFDVSENFYAFE